MKQCLAVDRATLTASLLRLALRREPLTVWHTRSAADALERLDDLPIDLVLVDDETVANDGSALLQTLAFGARSATPVVFVVTTVGGTAAPRAVESRVATLPKPLDLDALRRTLDQFLAQPPLPAEPIPDLALA